ncbi:MAG: DNA cytosine methyltransferase [Acidobacteria bacterium]|nr:DNA cytosine methyltransferase [Acidobacteriota bacterium]
MKAAAEFFAGMGLMRAALERCNIDTVYANDIDHTKARLYRENWGDGELEVADIRDVSGAHLPAVDVATASFPCVDLSLAGNRAGLQGERSGTVFEFFRVLGEMRNLPEIVVLENVVGFLSANDGQDFATVLAALEALGYGVGHICINAAAFVPQNRVRVFVVGIQGATPQIPQPPTPQPDLRLRSVIEDDAAWWGPQRLGNFLVSLSDVQSARVEAYQHGEPGCYGAYRRTRCGSAVWEVRADELAGTLRTTQGGSGRQAVLRAGEGDVAARWMNVREYAALQGAESLSYESVSENQAMYALGDAVCVPAVEWLARNCLLPSAAHAA